MKRAPAPPVFCLGAAELCFLAPPAPRYSDRAGAGESWAKHALNMVQTMQGGNDGVITSSIDSRVILIFQIGVVEIQLHLHMNKTSKDPKKGYQQRK